MSSYKAPVRTIGRLKRPFGNLYYEVSGSGPALLFAHGLNVHFNLLEPRCTTPA